MTNHDPGLDLIAIEDKLGQLRLKKGGRGGVYDESLDFESWLCHFNNCVF
jgi:hypothetical protein